MKSLAWTTLAVAALAIMGCNLTGKYTVGGNLTAVASGASVIAWLMELRLPTSTPKTGWYGGVPKAYRRTVLFGTKTDKACDQFPEEAPGDGSC